MQKLKWLYLVWIELLERTFSSEITLNRGLYQNAQKMWQEIVLGIKGYFWKSVLVSLFLNRDPLSVGSHVLVYMNELIDGSPFQIKTKVEYSDHSIYPSIYSVDRDRLVSYVLFV